MDPISPAVVSPSATSTPFSSTSFSFWTIGGGVCVRLRCKGRALALKSVLESATWTEILRIILHLITADLPLLLPSLLNSWHHLHCALFEQPFPLLQNSHQIRLQNVWNLCRQSGCRYQEPKCSKILPVIIAEVVLVSYIVWEMKERWRPDLKTNATLQAPRLWRHGYPSRYTSDMSPLSVELCINIGTIFTAKSTFLNPRYGTQKITPFPSSQAKINDPNS